MSVLALARWQFGITTVYHFFFVPLTLGLSILVALMETLYVRTGNPVYKKMTKFWGKLFLINFAMGVATGIVQEFQFGMNWSEYSRFVGDIFGAPLAVEALLAFFLESTFLGIWAFGWDKLPPKVHALTIWLVAIGSNISALWILIANAWMQHPVGYVLRNGRAEMENFFALLGNPHLPFEFGHVFFAGVATAGFFVLGISAWHLRRRPDGEPDFFRRSFRIGAVCAAIGALAVIGVGHGQGQEIMTTQPMKMAAAEALWNTERPAGMELLPWIDERRQTNTFTLRIPYALSILAFNKPDSEVQGIRNLQADYEKKYGPGNYVPPVTATFWSFRTMLAAGGLMMLLSWYALWVSRGGRLPAGGTLLFGALVPAIALPYIGNSAGWLMTELGRQPWIVFGVMKTEAGVSLATGAGEVLFTLVAFTLLYGALMAADAYLLRKFAVLGPSVPDDH